MKTIFTSALLCFAVSAFAQDTKKDTAQLYDYGARIYDARIGRPMSVDPKQSKENNPYQFADTTNIKQPANEPKKKAVKE